MTAQQINEASCTEYGCGVAALDSTAALWLAESLTKKTGVNVWKKIAKIRERHGLGTAFPEYKSICF